VSLPAPYYERDGIVIYHADCRDVLPHLEPVDLVLTDPPYGIAYRRGENKARASAARGGIAGDADTTVRDSVLSCLRDTAQVVFGSLYAPFPPDTRHVCVWRKRADAGLYGAEYGFRRDVEAVFLCGALPRRTVEWSSVLSGWHQERNGHPHAKPVGLCVWLADKFAGTILDPFMGSGTTLVAARDLGRKAIGIEIEERYCEIAAKRLAQQVFDFGETTP